MSNPHTESQADRVIATCQKSKRGEFRATLRTYNGERKVELRAFDEKPQGVFVPTPRFVVIQPSRLSDVIDLLHQAEDAARDEGLL